MPRGSRPGERRGGRQKGTPNKKTVLRNAALSAAAANPNTSPLDFFLNVIRDKSLLLETRIAAAREALPYFHSKPQDSLPRQATPGRYGNASSGGNGGWAGGRSINIKITKGGSEAPESESEAELTPLGFLLGVMRAADTPPHLRLQVASLVARYLHPKRGGDGPPKIVVEDPTSFSIDPELAMEFRDAKFRYDIVCRGRNSHPEDYEREAPDLEIRIAELESSLQCPCPSMYSKKQYDRDQERLKELARVRHSGLKLSRQEDVEEAWLTARVASWWTTPQAAAYERMFQLDLRDWNQPYSTAEPLSLREKAEFRALKMLYPRNLPIDMTKPGAANFRTSKQSDCEHAFKDYPREDEPANRVGRPKESAAPREEPTGA
jgi:hypothetical protein